MNNLRNISVTLITIFLSISFITEWHLIFRLETPEPIWAFDMTSFINYVLMISLFIFFLFNIEIIRINSIILLFLILNILFLILNIIFAEPNFRFVFLWLYWSIFTTLIFIIIVNNYYDSLQKVLKFLFFIHIPFALFVILIIIIYAGPLGSNILPQALISQYGYNELTHATEVTKGSLSNLWFTKHAFGWCFLFLITYAYYVRKNIILPILLITFLLMNRSIMVGFIGSVIILFFYSNLKMSIKIVCTILFLILFGLVIFYYNEVIFSALSKDSRWTLISILPFIALDFPFGIGVGTFHLPEVNNMLVERYANQIYLDGYLEQFPWKLDYGWLVPPVTESNVVLFLSSFGIIYFFLYIIFFFRVIHFLFININKIDDFSKFLIVHSTIIIIAGIGEDSAHTLYYWINSAILIGVYFRYSLQSKEQ